MPFPIITADQRLAENRRSSGVILGPAGVGKTKNVVKSAIQPDSKEYAALIGAVSRALVPTGGFSSSAPAAHAAPAAAPSVSTRPTWAQ